MFNFLNLHGSLAGNVTISRAKNRPYSLLCHVNSEPEGVVFDRDIGDMSSQYLRHYNQSSQFR